MDFLQLAWEYKWITMDELRFLVITEEEPWGEITPEEFEIITGEKFLVQTI